MKVDVETPDGTVRSFENIVNVFEDETGNVCVVTYATERTEFDGDARILDVELEGNETECI
ncbi:MAG: hypothetical protein PPP58_08660 [Natronomonas sp.]